MGGHIMEYLHIHHSNAFVEIKNDDDDMRIVAAIGQVSGHNNISKYYKIYNCTHTNTTYLVYFYTVIFVNLPSA